MPRNSECKNVGKDEEGLQFLKDYDEYVKIRTKALEKELNLCNSKPAVRLAPVIFICSVCEIEGFNSKNGVFKHVERVHGPQQQLVCKEGPCGDKTFGSAGTLKAHTRKYHKGKNATICQEC